MLSCILLHFHDICTVAIKNIRNMHAVSINQIADILHFNDKENYKTFTCLFESFKQKSKKNYCHNLLITNGNDMKRTWATIKEIRGSKKSSATWPRDF